MSVSVPKFLFLEGNIGSGKSTFFKELQKYFPNVKFINEPVDTWESIVDENGNNMIQNYYKDKKKYAFSFQIMAYGTRVKLLFHELNKMLLNPRNNTKPHFICERSIYTDKNVFVKMLQDEKIITKQEKTIYDHLFMDDNFDKLSIKYLYVDTDPQLCYDRIKLRGRKGETIDLNYLKKCDVYHKKWFDGISNEKIIRVNGKDNFNEKSVMNKYINKIKTFLNS